MADIGDGDSGKTGRAGLDDLVGIDDEVFAQDRQFHRRFDRGEVVERALEVVLIRQAGDRGRAVGFVGLCNRNGVEVFADHAGRGAGLLDLGDDTECVFRPGQRGEEVARRRGVERTAFHLVQRDTRDRRGDLAAFVLYDLLKDVAQDVSSQRW